MSNKQYDELLEQIDSYILNTLAHASLTPYEISASLDGFLDRYHISLRTITHRLNELQLDCMIACICPEAEPERSFFSLRIPVEDVPMFHLDDNLIDDLCDTLNLIPVENSTDTVYLTNGEDSKPILHIEEEELVILEVDVEDEEIIADLNNAEQNSEEEDEDSSALPLDDVDAYDDTEDAESDEDYAEPTDVPSDINSYDEVPYNNDENAQVDEQNVSNQEETDIAQDIADDIAVEGAEKQDADAIEESTAIDETYSQKQEDDDSDEANSSQAEEEAPSVLNNSDDVDEIIEYDATEEEAEETDILTDKEVAAIEDKDETESGSITDGREELVMPEYTEEPVVHNEIQEPTDSEKIIEELTDDTVVENDENTVESVNDSEEDKAEEAEESVSNSEQVESVVNSIESKNDSIADDEQSEEISEEADAQQQATEPIEEIEQEEDVVEAASVRRMAFSRADIQQELEDNPETREKRLASMKLLGLIGDQNEEELAQEVEEAPASDQEQIEQSVPSPAIQSYSAVMRPQNDLEYYLQEVETEKHYAYKSVLHNLFNTNYAPKTEADVDTKITMEECSSFSEFREEMRKKGYDVRQYVVQHTVQYYSKKYINVNSIAFATACLTYLLAVALLLVGFFAFDKYANLSYKPYLCTGLVLFAIPIFYGVKYLAYKDKHAPATFSFKLSFATAFMVSLILSMVFLLVAFFYPKSNANISDVNTLIAPVFYPAAMLLLIPISVVIYALLYRTRKFYVL